MKWNCIFSLLLLQSNKGRGRGWQRHTPVRPANSRERADIGRAGYATLREGRVSLWRRRKAGWRQRTGELQGDRGVWGLGQDRGGEEGAGEEEGRRWERRQVGNGWSRRRHVRGRTGGSPFACAWWAILEKPRSIGSACIRMPWIGNRTTKDWRRRGLVRRQ